MQEPINFAQTRFLQSAQTLHQCPPDAGCEVAFAGRSNAGKSSAINALTRQSKLARTSKTPGRTQLINFFSLAENQRLVDLPGYGFAKVAKATKAEWDRHLADYLQRRQSLRGLVLLMDSRHPLQPYDTQIIRWAAAAAMPVHLLLTKADKLSNNQAKSTLLGVQKTLKQEGLAENLSAQTFSALKKTGLETLEARISEWLTAAPDISNQSF